MDELIFDPYHRRSIRLKGYDYSLPGGYFITIVCYQRESLFGNIINGRMEMNPHGQNVDLFWRALTYHFGNITLGSFVVMPNHFHGIIFIKDPNMDFVNHTRAGHRPAPTKSRSLSEIVRSFKSFSSNKINQLRNTQGLPVWQRNYYEHIIRDDEELNLIKEYIENNVVNWRRDKEYIET
jgi:putative transposase